MALANKVVTNVVVPVLMTCRVCQSETGQTDGGWDTKCFLPCFSLWKGSGWLVRSSRKARGQLMIFFFFTVFMTHWRAFLSVAFCPAEGQSATHHCKRGPTTFSHLLFLSNWRQLLCFAGDLS